MINYYLTEAGILRKITEPESNCWISMVAPTEQELAAVSEHYGLEIDVLRTALDIDERSRIEVGKNYNMILVNVPTIDEKSQMELYNTLPLSIVTVQDIIITVCNDESPALDAFTRGKVRDFDTQMRPRFILQVLYQIDTLYLQYLRNIDKKSDAVETILQKSTQNRELIELLKLEKSLVYFTTALRSNEAVLERLPRTEFIIKYPENMELLEDVIVENKQAIEMTEIYSGILSGMMDAFASVISNNLNIVMKMLAVVTIVMSIPTIIFSAYGMNVNIVGMPFADSPWGFLIIIALTAVLSVIATLVFSKLKLFK